MLVLTRVKQATKEFIKILRFGKDDVHTADSVTPHGIDSKPVKDALAIYARTNSSEQAVILGYLKNFDKTSEGETRIFATDADGAEVFDIYLKKDGTCEIGGNSDFMVRFNKLKEGFDQLLSDHNDLVNAFNTHVHATAATGPPSPPTAVPPDIPATPSAASIDDSKIDEIKTL